MYALSVLRFHSYVILSQYLHPFPITAFAWTLRVITLVGIGRCSRMHLQIKPAPDTGACQQYGDRSNCVVMST